MMEAVKHYLLAVTAAGLLCGIAGTMLGEKSAVGRIGRTVTGAVLALVMLGPLTGLRLGSLPDRIGDFAASGTAAAEKGSRAAAAASAEVLKTGLEAYILDKAASLNATVTAEVVVTEENIPQVDTVRLTGAVAPYARGQLAAWMEQTLGIDREKQIWIG